MPFKAEDYIQLWTADHHANNKWEQNSGDRVYLACCDCGAVHTIDLAIKPNNQIEIEITKDDAQTAVVRAADDYDFQRVLKEQEERWKMERALNSGANRLREILKLMAKDFDVPEKEFKFWLLQQENYLIYNAHNDVIHVIDDKG